MRNWLYWGIVVAAGLVIGGGSATGALHVTGVDRPHRSSLQTEALAADLTTSAAPRGGDRAKESRPADGGGKPKVAQATPTPEPPPPPPPPPKSLFDDSQIISYYGHPLSGALGALGQGSEDEMIGRLKKQAAAFQAVNPDKTVVPALHLIYEVAQQFTADDGLYLYRTDDETVRHFIQLTQSQGMLLFLDLQIGRSTLARELDYVLPYMKEANVHLAIDPEFVTPPGQRPGLDIGTLDALDINAAIQRVQAQAEQTHLANNKIVIVHQFRDYMLINKDKLDYNQPRVDVVLNMDGFGGQETKIQNYNILVAQDSAKYGGIKLFYKYDVNLMSEQQVEDLVPRPSVIMYQ